MVQRGEILDDSMEDEFYLRRLDAGLFVLQLLCYIMVEISNAGISQLQQRVHQILNLRGGSVKAVRHIMRGELRVSRFSLPPPLPCFSEPGFHSLPVY
ncbi:hypothetical protein NFI96_004151 [Prochilodus magdalenae]|nr:hypothetical protein NFI96_004151 [Prochilodus magdalenae]